MPPPPPFPIPLLLRRTSSSSSSRGRGKTNWSLVIVILLSASSSLASATEETTSKNRRWRFWYVTPEVDRNGVNVNGSEDTAGVAAGYGESTDDVIPVLDPWNVVKGERVAARSNDDGDFKGRSNANAITKDGVCSTCGSKTPFSSLTSDIARFTSGSSKSRIVSSFLLPSLRPTVRKSPQVFKNDNDVFMKRELPPVITPIFPSIQSFTSIQAGTNSIAASALSYIAVQSFVVILNLLFWDNTRTAPQEQLTAANLVNIVTNPIFGPYNMMAVFGSGLVYSLFLISIPLITTWFPSLKSALLGLGKKRRRKRSLTGAARISSNSSNSFGEILSMANRESAIGEWDEESSARFFTLPWTVGNWTQAVRNWICPYCVTRVITFNTISLAATWTIWSLAAYLYPNNWASGKKKKRRRRSDGSEESDEERAKRAYNKKDEYLGLVEELQQALYRSFVKYGGGVEEEEYKDKKESLALKGNVTIESSMRQDGAMTRGAKVVRNLFSKAQSFHDVFMKRSLPPVTAPVLAGGVNFYTPVQAGTNSILAVVFVYVATQTFVILLNLLFWDNSSTAPQEKLSNFPALVNVLTNPIFGPYNFIAVFATTLMYALFLLIPPIIITWFPSVKTFLLSLGKKKRKRRGLIGTTGFNGSSSGGGGGGILSMSNRDSAIGEWDEESSARFFTLPWTIGNWTQAVRNWICPYCVTRVITFNTISLAATWTVWSLAAYLYPNNWASGKKKKRKRRFDGSEESDEERAKRAYNQKDEYLGLVEELQHALYRSFVKYGGGVDEEEYKEKKESFALEGTIAAETQS